MIQIEQTADGSQTLFVPELNEHYHSVKGALTEYPLYYLGTLSGQSGTYPTTDLPRTYLSGKSH